MPAIVIGAAGVAMTFINSVFISILNDLRSRKNFMTKMHLVLKDSHCGVIHATDFRSSVFRFRTDIVFRFSLEKKQQQQKRSVSLEIHIHVISSTLYGRQMARI